MPPEVLCPCFLRSFCAHTFWGLSVSILSEVFPCPCFLKSCVYAFWGLDVSMLSEVFWCPCFLRSFGVFLCSCFLRSFDVHPSWSLSECMLSLIFLCLMLSEIFLCPTLPVGSRISVAKGLGLIRKYDQNQRSKNFFEKISLYVSVSAGIYFN